MVLGELRDGLSQDDPYAEPSRLDRLDSSRSAAMSRARSRANRLWILGLLLTAVGLALLVVYAGGARWQSIAGMSALVVGCVPIILASFIEGDLRSGVEQ